MQRTPLFQLLAVVVVGTAAAGCADSPTRAAEVDTDPAVAAANRTAGTEGRVYSMSRQTQGTPVQQTASVNPEVRTLIAPPAVCQVGDPNPSCAQIFVNASVSQGSPFGSLKTAVLYAELEAVDNVNTSSLNITYGSAGGCASSPGTFDQDRLSGGSTSSGAYILSGQRTPAYEGSFKWSVSATGRGFSPLGTLTSDAAYDVSCL